MATSAERMRNLRARRLAQLEAPGGPPDEPPLLRTAVDESLTALQLDDRHAAVAALARLVARTVDQAEDGAAALRVFGGLFLKILMQLHATPSSAGVRGRPGAAGSDPLDRLPVRGRQSWLDDQRASHAKRHRDY